MSVPDDLEVYADLCVLRRIKQSDANLVVNGIGMRPNTDAEEWVDYYPMGTSRMRNRRDRWMGRVLFQIACNARIEEGREDKDTFAPQRLASKMRKLFEHVDLQITKVGKGEDHLGVLNISEARQRYLPRRNITFQGEGNFGMEQGNVHTVVVTFQATLIVV